MLTSKDLRQMVSFTNKKDFRIVLRDQQLPVNLYNITECLTFRKQWKFKKP